MLKGHSIFKFSYHFAIWLPTSFCQLVVVLPVLLVITGSEDSPDSTSFMLLLVLLLCYRVALQGLQCNIFWQLKHSRRTRQSWNDHPGHYYAKRRVPETEIKWVDFETGLLSLIASSSQLVS